MGKGSRLNISIKNDRIVILETRAAAIEALLNARLESSIKASADLSKTINELLTQEVFEIKQSLEVIYEELLSRTARGRMKRLAGWLNRKKGKK